jgi:transcriptional regulator with XRE-family HTH domain
VTKVRNKKLLTQFGIHLRKVRIENSLSQEQLANDADIPINQIGRIERGEVNPSLSTLEAISKALNLKLPELLNFSQK